MIGPLPRNNNRNSINQGLGDPLRHLDDSPKRSRQYKESAGLGATLQGLSDPLVGGSEYDQFLGSRIRASKRYSANLGIKYRSVLYRSTRGLGKATFKKPKI